ncbi:nucleoporin autopeptidase [Tanacetum coccineum]
MWDGGSINLCMVCSSAFGSTTMPGPFESSFQQSQPGFSLCMTFPNSPCGSTHIEVSSQPASSNTTSAFGQCVSVTVTPFSDTTPKSADFTLPPAGIQISVNPCSSSTSTNQIDTKKSSVFPPFQSAPSGFCPNHGFRQSTIGCQCVSVTSGSACTQKPVSPWSPSTSTNHFAPTMSTLSNPVKSTPSGFCPNHSLFGCQCSVSKVTPYSQTPKADNGRGTQPAGKLFSISAMPAYKEKNHEELRCEDYQLGDKVSGTGIANW